MIEWFRTVGSMILSKIRGAHWDEVRLARMRIAQMPLMIKE